MNAEQADHKASEQATVVAAEASTDLNLDPISGSPGSHPVGTALGSAGAAAAGAAIGAMFGPVGFLVGGTLGAVAGGAAGHAVAEQIDPTAEVEYWRGAWRLRSYFDPQVEYEQEFAPAFLFGVHSYGWLPMTADGKWDERSEQRLQSEWKSSRGPSSLEWGQARQAVRDAWERTHQTHQAYAQSDAYWRDRSGTAPYHREGADFDRDYRMAYRYGTYARSRYFDRAWNDQLEQELKKGWPGFSGDPTPDWELALPAVRDAFEFAHQLPGELIRDSKPD